MKNEYGPLWRDSKLAFTEEGEKKAKAVIREALAKRKEALDAKKDTADLTPEPTVESLLEEVEAEGFDAFGECQISVNVTDNCELDKPFSVEYGKDVYWEPMDEEKKREAINDAYEAAQEVFVQSLVESGFNYVWQSSGGGIGWKDPATGKKMATVITPEMEE